MLVERFRLRLFNSRAIRNPMMEISRAVVLRYHGIVKIDRLVGGILLEIKKPARILPMARRLIGLIILGSFSLIVMRGRCRGFDIITK